MPSSIASWTRCQPVTGAAADSPASSAITVSRAFLSFAYGARRVSPVRCRRLRGNGLVSEECGEEAAAGEELLGPALLDDPAAVEHGRDVGDADRRQALRRDEDRAPGDRRPQVLHEQ